MILRKDYVQLIRDGKAQVEVEKTEEHNEMLNLIFTKRCYHNIEGMGKYFMLDDESIFFGYRSFSVPHSNLPIIHASDIILDNTVIKVLDEEGHGRRVIEWWKEQGVNTCGNRGSFTDWYYGLRNGVYGFYDKHEISICKIITLPETFPSKQEIKQENKMRTITWQEAQELIDMVDISCQWKGKLLDLWAKSIVLKLQIVVSDELLQQGRKEASQSQKEVIDRIFGKEKEEIDLWRGKGIGNIDLYFKDSSIESLISLGRGRNAEFFLNPEFNWSIEGNYLRVSHK